MPNQFATQEPTTQDSETVLIRKASYSAFQYASQQGATELEEPTAGDNPTQVLRKMAVNLFRLVTLLAVAVNVTDPASVVGETFWIRSIAESLYALASI